MLFIYRVMEFWKSHWVACSLFFEMFVFLNFPLCSHLIRELTHKSTESDEYRLQSLLVSPSRQKYSNPHFNTAWMIYKVESLSTQEYPEERRLKKQYYKYLEWTVRRAESSWTHHNVSSFLHWSLTKL